MSKVQHREPNCNQNLEKSRNDVRGSVDGWDFKAICFRNAFIFPSARTFRITLKAAMRRQEYAELDDSIITEKKSKRMQSRQRVFYLPQSVICQHC